MQSISTYVKHPDIFLSTIVVSLGALLPDKLYLKLLYRLKMGYWPNLRNPKTFSEKLQWLKLYDHNPKYTAMVDKIMAKEYVSKIIEDKYIIPTIGVWSNFDEIDFEKLPERFVLKTNNGGGNNGVVICKDKTCFDIEKARVKLTKSMKQNIYKTHREWPYKNVKSKIFAEKFLEEIKSPNKRDLDDYKWYCFNGEPKYCQVIQGRSTRETIDFFDLNWNHQEFVGLQSVAGVTLGNVFRNAEILPSRPTCLEEQIEIARQLSKELPFSRIDLYEVNENVYFGEITFFPLSGFGEFNPKQYNLLLGEMLTLPCKNN